MLTFVLTFSDIVVVVLLVVVSFQQTRSHRKRSRVSGRPIAQKPLKTDSIHKSLPFLDFSPASSDFRCIWPYTNTGEKCANRIDQATDRPWANTLRKTIACDSPYNELVEDMLREYAEFCICRLHRPSASTSSAIIDCWVQQWLGEIRALYDSLCNGLSDKDGAVAEGVLLYPQTTVSAESEIQDPEETVMTDIRPQSQMTEQHTAIKRESVYRVPGSFPGNDIFPEPNRRLAPGHPSPNVRRSSTPETTRKYSQTIRDSPPGIKLTSFRRPSSTTPRLDSTPAADFKPYPDELKRTLLNVINEPLGSKGGAPGYVYIFTRRSDEGTHSLYVKIGVTEDIKKRFKVWKTTCYYEPHLEYHTAWIPNAMRVELLVHTELNGVRYIEQQCSGCNGPHDEWFKTDVDNARIVVERWAQWMQECRPYTQEGQLASHVVKGIFRLKRSKAPLNSETLLPLAPNKAAAQGAQQSQPESTECHRKVPSSECLDPASPCLQESNLTSTVADLTADSDEEDIIDLMQSPSPSPTQVRVRFGAQNSSLDIRRVRKRNRSNGDEPGDNASATRTESKDVEVKPEPEIDFSDNFASDVEASDSQESYHDAEPSPGPSPSKVATEVELGSSSACRRQTPSGPSEGLELPILVDC